MPIHDTDYDLLSPDYIQHTEEILQELARSRHRIVKARLQDSAVYIVTDMQLAKQIFEDGKAFTFTPSQASTDDAMADGTRAFVDEGLESSLLSASYEDYKETRSLFNQALKRGFLDRLEFIERRAAQHIAALLDQSTGPDIDALALSRQYWMPLIADILGLGSLSFAQLMQLASYSRILVEANGLQGDRESVKQLAEANQTIVAMIGNVVAAGVVPEQSVVGFFLSRLDEATAIDFTRTFVLAAIDTGSSALALQTHLLAGSSEQRDRFLAMTELQQRAAITELASKEAPTYYTPRFTVADITLEGEKIPAGSFIQLALYGINRCANPDFDIQRSDVSRCPVHNHEAYPFGHARHKCPGETLARHLIPIFLAGLFGRYSSIAIKSCCKELNSFSRSISELILNVEGR
jgi:cytochrome P450